jgi:AmmeMemoRadiSam system protein A
VFSLTSGLWVQSAGDAIDIKGAAEIMGHFGLFALVMLIGFSNPGEFGEQQKDIITLADAGQGVMPAEKTGEKEGRNMETGPLTEAEGKYLLCVARETIDKELKGEEPKWSDADLAEKFNERRGTFVTLTIRGRLRGCIGHIVPQEPLIEGVRVNAINAAFKDPRFSPLGLDEWKNVKIEVSILTEPNPLKYENADDLLKKIRPEIDGIILKKGFRQATFLPQVWEQLPNKEDFLKHLCLKAGLPSHAWLKGDLEISTYQVQAFEE